MVETRGMRNRVSGGVGDLMLSPKSKDAASKAAPPSPSDDHHNLPKDLKMGWHSTVGGAPTGRGSTPLKRILSNVGAILIILATPPFATLIVWTNFSGDGTFGHTMTQLWNKGPWFLWEMVAVVTPEAVKYVSVYAAFEALLMVFMPGKTFVGPTTAGGNRPVYKANGMQCFFATLIVYVALYWAGILKPLAIAAEVPAMIAFLNFLSPVIVSLLVLKGYYLPSDSDSGSSGNLVMDVYWGVELYPRLFWGYLDVKTFTNCRFGMMGWAVLIVTYALAQFEEHGRIADSMLVSTFLQLLYVAKFFWWETGYWGSIDIMHDRAGWMICWGCLVWVPSVYTSPAMYLLRRPIHLGYAKAALMVALGVSSVFLNFDSDRQRQVVRKANGKGIVWGKPAEVIRAKYLTAAGEVKDSILLVCGWWGVVRHFNYVPELCAAFLWSVPCLFNSGLPYFYFTFLLILLSDRARRDDQRCRSKYGKYWDEYCKRVPYRMIPFVY